MAKQHGQMALVLKGEKRDLRKIHQVELQLPELSCVVVLSILLFSMGFEKWLTIFFEP